MIYGKYHISGRFESEALLPKYKGSTFRGIFGIALKRVVCVLRSQNCSECMLSNNCLYAKIFEKTNITKCQYNSYNYPYNNPFVIEPPLTTETCFKKDSTFDFKLLLFGEENRNLAYFIFARDQMGKIGIGKKVNGQRGTYKLEYVKYKDSLVYSHHDNTLTIPDDIENITLNDIINNDYISCSKIQINIITPFRVKINNKFAKHLPFHLLIRTTLRRIGSLFSWHGNEVPSFDYKQLISDAQKITISESNLKWFELKRYSHRQNQSMLIGGLIGSIVYEGNISQFIPFIDFASKVHIGKQTSFGLGKIEYEILE